VPGESTDPGDRTTAIALVMGVAEVLGGFAAPAVTGFAADYFGLVIVPIVAGGAAVAAGVVSLFLTETAPRLAGSAQLHPVPA
jgi:sugar phosphate permease